jgi:hypothetical protein
MPQTQTLTPVQMAARAVDTYFQNWIKARLASVDSWFCDNEDTEFVYHAIDDVYEAVAVERRKDYPNESEQDTREFGYRDAAYMVGVQIGLRLQKIAEVQR